MWDIKNIISEIQTKLRNLITCHLYKGNCTKTEADFLLSKIFIYDIPHFYIIWKILKNPIVGRPIVAGYINPRFNFCRSLFERVLFQIRKYFTDSLSLIKLLENTVFDKDYFLFTNRLQKFIPQHFCQGRHKNN